MDESQDGDAVGLIAHFLQQPPVPGSGDVLALGAGGAVQRAGEVGFALVSLVLNGVHPYDRVMVMVPPTVQWSEPALRQAIKDAAARSNLHPADDALDGIITAIEPVFLQTLYASDLLKKIEAVPARVAIMALDVATYRWPDMPPLEQNFLLPGDTWGPHVVRTVSAAMATTSARGTFLVFDLGEGMPSRASLRQELLAIQAIGLLSSEQDEIEQSTVDKVDLAHRNGEERKLLAELINDASLAPQSRDLLRIQLLARDGRISEARTILEADESIVEGLQGRRAIQVASLAQRVGAERAAIQLLRVALPGLRHLEDIEGGAFLAHKLTDGRLTNDYIQRAETIAPGSEVRAALSAQQLIERGEHAAAARVLASLTDPTYSRAAEFWRHLAEFFDAWNGDRTQLDSFVAETSKAFPEFRAETANACYSHLVDRGYHEFALHLAATRLEEGQKDALKELVWVVRSSLIAGRFDGDAKQLVAILERVIHHVAGAPGDVSILASVKSMLEARIAGSAGLTALISAVVRLYSREPRIREAGVSTTCTPEELRENLERILRWMATVTPVVIGRERVPNEILTCSRRALIGGLTQLVEAVSQETGPPERDELSVMLATAAALAADESGITEDINLIRLVAARLVMAGRGQFARDLAEQALMLSRGEPDRVRAAWLAYAEVYARSGDLYEAFVALGCAFATGQEAAADQAFYETLLLVRLLRDQGVVALAAPLIPEAQRRLANVAGAGQYALRLRTMDLHIEMRRLESAAEREPIERLLQEAVVNVKEVMAVGDEIAPAASLLGGVISLLEFRGIPVPDHAREVWRNALGAAEPAVKAVIEAAASRRPTLGQLVALAARTEPARYAEDVSADYRLVSLLAKRMLDTEGRLSPEDICYAIEARTELGIELPTTSERGQTVPIMASGSGPMRTAEAIAGRGIPVLLLGAGHRDVLSVLVTSGTDPRVRREQGVDILQLPKWSERYPFDYGDAQDANEFYVTTQALMLSDLPEKVVVISTRELQRVPPGIFQVENELLGRYHCVAAAPSLSWLEAATAAPRSSRNRRIGWFPSSMTSSGLDTVDVLRERLSETLARHRCEVNRQGNPDARFDDAELVVAVAHGGVADPKRYFRAMFDEAGAPIRRGRAEWVLGGANVVILFVCSGGRLDEDLGVNATTGLARELLDRGTQAVVASAWPLSASVPPYWLGTFLERWDTGDDVADACRRANENVRNVLGANPALWLAMSVYGNPLTRATSHEARGATAALRGG